MIAIHSPIYLYEFQIAATLLLVALYSGQVLQLDHNFVCPLHFSVTCGWCKAKYSRCEVKLRKWSYKYLMSSRESFRRSTRDALSNPSSSQFRFALFVAQLVTRSKVLWIGDRQPLCATSSPQFRLVMSVCLPWKGRFSSKTVLLWNIFKCKSISVRDPLATNAKLY